MTLFKFCGFTLQSDVPLPELGTTDEGCAHYTFYLEAAQNQADEGWGWLHHWHVAEDELSLSYTRIASVHCLRFPYRADFLISQDLREIHCYPTFGTPLEDIRHLFLDQVLPRCLAQQNMVMLHASAVLHPSGALVFVGDSGVGKSTLAASFAQRGMPILTDDCLLLTEQNGKSVIIPSYSGLRLWEDSVSAIFKQPPRLLPFAKYTTKKRVGLLSNTTAIQTIFPIRQFYFLASPEAEEVLENVTITSFTPRTAFMKLIKQTFRLDVTDQQKSQQLFILLGQITKALPVFQLTFPRDYQFITRVQQVILDSLNETT